MKNDNSRRDLPREMVSGLKDRLTEAAIDRFGEPACELAKTARPLPMQPEWRDHDFVEVLLAQAVPWAQTKMVAFGRQSVADRISKRLQQPMREFGERAAATSDGSIAGRIERAQPSRPMP